ncbi:hypothetical protein O1611_g2306 [Lasiodiplodia mahajangana]|uniref:Uncharacterized protein n=1 Tax=Lasiodiplodia mahajangana TaxID=1108764 RepID=A0ACC2JUW2_9PEZI|nr:hypothetical protein O1611_g2306 [Lasiodiplodia mahajangana]
MSTEDAPFPAPVAPPTIIATVTIAIGFSTLFTALRMYTRWFVQKRLWWDDWVMVSAWLTTIALCVIQLVMIRYGAGLKLDDVSRGKLKQFARLFTDAQEVARAAIFLAKASILLLYLRLFYPHGIHRSALWWVIWATILVNLLYTVSFVLVSLLACGGRSSTTGGACSNHWSVLIVASAINVASDLIVLVIPIVSVWGLRLSKRRKWTLAAAFSFGALAPIISIGRLWYQVSQGFDLTEITLAFTLSTLITIAEQTVAMIIGSAPVCSALVRKYAHKKRHLAPNPNPTISQRIWPTRVGRSDPDAFRIADPVGTTSTEVLYLEPHPIDHS